MSDQNGSGDGFDFEALADRAVTVQVGGGPVTLGLAAPSSRHAMLRELNAGVDLEKRVEANQDDLDAKTDLAFMWGRLEAMALEATVREPLLTTEKWGQVLISVRDDPVEGFKEMVVQALKLSGIGVASGENDDDIQDHTKEAVEVLTDIPT